jgi:oligopeptide/dipeptide ABC transporter ATP-binding protein
MRQIADRIAVMYLGHVVEIGPSESLYEHPKHPYTAALLSAVPRPSVEGDGRHRIVLGGDVPSPVSPPPACVFHTRCPRFHRGHCDVETPLLRELEPGQEAACHYPLERWPMTDEEIRQAEGAERADKPRLRGARADAPA